MLRFELTENFKWLRLVSFDDRLELRQLEITFLKKVKNYWFYEKKGWNGEINFFPQNAHGRFIAAGLWGELVKMGKQHNIEVEIVGLDKLFYDLKYDDYKKWCEDFFAGAEKPPRDYQIDAAFKAVMYRFSAQELGTNAGKTMMAFMTIAYLMQHKLIKKTLIVVPNTTLVEQMAGDFYNYEKHRPEDKRVGMKKHLIYGGAEPAPPDANVVIGTFQSIVKMGPELLNMYDYVIIDEAHHTTAMSIKKILSKCESVRWKFGMTGTFGDEKWADFFTIQQFLGPMVNKVSVDFLTKNDFATTVDIRVIKLNYLDNEIREKLFKNRALLAATDPVKAYQMERAIVVRNHKRLEFICEMIAKSTKNSMVLFRSVQDEYGMRIYNRVREMSSEKEVFYVDGSVKADLRDEYKKRMEEGSNRVLIASYQTFAEGISINNLHNIFLAESYRSEAIVRQAIGRMMRLHDEKAVAIVIDFVDDFSYKSKVNHLLKHANERMLVYAKEKFKYSVFDVDLNKLYS